MPFVKVHALTSSCPTVKNVAKFNNRYVVATNLSKPVDSAPKEFRYSIYSSFGSSASSASIFAEIAIHSAFSS